MSPVGDTGTLSTPLRANAPAHDASSIESTQNSRGAAVISEHIGVLGVMVKKLRPWIQRDIEQAKQCKVGAVLQALLQRASCAPETKQPELLQKCLKAVLPVCNGQVSAEGISSLGIEKALPKYVRPGAENDFYGPCTEATNAALACLEEIKVDGMGAAVSTVDMICQQNDKPMYQTHQTKTSMRKPDLVLLPLNSVCSAFQADDNKRKKKDNEKDDTKDDTKDDVKDDERHDEKRKKKRKTHMDTNAKAKPKNPP